MKKKLYKNNAVECDEYNQKDGCGYGVCTNYRDCPHCNAQEKKGDDYLISLLGDDEGYEVIE